ncbi:MAG: hypothetical protein QF619_09905 [Candidatus Binatia bacterium]|nr:hypothetical protein [Candidatus Binatia bacterium]
MNGLKILSVEPVAVNGISGDRDPRGLFPSRIDSRGGRFCDYGRQKSRREILGEIVLGQVWKEK